jgi:hypothetical protein
MEGVLREIRKGLLEDKNGPEFVLGQHVVLTIENMIDVCKKCEKMLTEDDTLAVMSMVDVLTATSVFLALLKMDKDKAADMIMSGYNLAFASRFFDLPETSLDDPSLKNKIIVCRELIKANANMQRAEEEKIKKSSASTTRSIISNMKAAN